MEADYSSLRVLVIDDQQIARQFERGVLGGMGIEQVVEVNSCREALQAVTARGAAFDLILCDLRMPGQDGIETIRAFANLGLHCAIAILSVEDERVIASAGSLATLRGLNLVGALSKPLTAEKLEPVLRAASETRRPKPRRIVDVAEADVREALARGELEMHYQPKIHLHSGECVGAEAVLRWMHPLHGQLEADVLAPVLERSAALRKEMTEFTAHQAIAACGAWRAAGRDIGVSINLSPLTFEQVDLPDLLEAITMEHGVLPASVTVEVPETILADNPAMMVDVAARLRIKGFHLALDEFTGRHSAVDEVLTVPFNELKLDRTCVDGCSEQPVRRAMVEAGMAIARNLHLSTVAVGVIQRPDWELLADLGCEFAQGPFIARPMPEAGFAVWLPQWTMHKQRH